MPRFDLTVQAFETPATSSSMRFNLALPFSRGARDPLYPATRLQLAYNYSSNETEIFIPDAITSKDLLQTGQDSDVYSVEVPLSDIPRARVREGSNGTAQVTLYAWQGEKLLGQWPVGEIEDSGLVESNCDGPFAR